jgi:hypothetical protein
MTKLNVARELKDVIDGTSGHTIARVWKTGRSWNIETSISDYNDYDDDNSVIYKHYCNDITLREVIEILNKDF